MIVDRTTGEIILFYNFMDLDREPDIYYLHMVKSRDHGASWSEAVDITSQISKTQWHKDFKFMTSGRGIQTRSGRLLHCMVNLDHGLHLFYSDDHGETWQLIDTALKIGDESKVVELADGRWMVNSRSNKKGMRFVHVSDDRGSTWETRAEPELIDPGCNASIIRYTSIEDGFSKNRLLFCNAKMEEGRKNLTVRISYDEGLTWSEGKTIYPGSAAYSSMTILENGDIGVLFEKDYYSQNMFVSFSLEWLTDGQDRIPEQAPVAMSDWLIQSPEIKAEVYKSQKEIVISNGLVSRTIRLEPNAASVSLRNLVTGEEYIRSVKPEALVSIDGISYPVGGLTGQKEHGYLKMEWLDAMQSPGNAFVFQDLEISEIADPFPWKQTRWIASSQWKRSGRELTFIYAHPDHELGGITVEVHYEIYDNLPLLGKWIVVRNGAEKDIRINHFTSEIIAHPEQNNYVDEPSRWDLPNLYMENDYAFGGFTYVESPNSIHWETDPDYTSQVNWEMKTPCILKSQPATGPDYLLKPGEDFVSFRTFTLALDGSDRERKGLSIRKMYRTLAPWITENPIFMHLTTTNPKKVKSAIDQCVETGYEMVILSFGSGLNMEDLSDKNIRKFRELADYAHERGIQLGGYSLFSSRKIGPETDIIDRETGKPGGAKFGNAPCGLSQWGIEYYQKLEKFLEQTGFDILEHDGPYPGDFCASGSHPGHEGHEDSQWKQWKQATDFYKSLRSKGLYMNLPDIYHLSGSNKIGIGYREVNWSLPREQQILLGRQNIYDGTWLKPPSMAWTFVPLTVYHGGGAAATLEPLAEHLPEYDAHMTQNYGSGVQACYRGPRLYDTEETRELVIRKIYHYKKFRDILNADIIHLRRPDGRDWDGILHVDPKLDIKGYALLYNPTGSAIHRSIALPLYYTGLSKAASISIGEEPPAIFTLHRDFHVEVEVEIPANAYLPIIIK